MYVYNRIQDSAGFSQCIRGNSSDYTPPCYRQDFLAGGRDFFRFSALEKLFFILFLNVSHAFIKAENRYKTAIFRLKPIFGRLFWANFLQISLEYSQIYFLFGFEF